MAEFPELVDSHCHLDFPDFCDDLSDVVERARDKGVRRMVTICTSLGSVAAVAEIAARYDGVFFAAGTHPHRAASDPLVSLEQLLNLSKHSKFIAVGESGLDFHYTRSTADMQKKSLLLHIEAARQLDLPLIIHSRNADMAMAEILKSEFRNGEFRCVMHCYSSGAELARSALELGFYLSMSGIVTFPNASALREIFTAVPINRILVETDAPYLAPPPFRGKRNEPSYVTEVASVGAALFGLSHEQFAEQTTANFDRLFHKAARQADS